MTTIAMTIETVGGAKVAGVVQDQRQIHRPGADTTEAEDGIDHHRRTRSVADHVGVNPEIPGKKEMRAFLFDSDRFSFQVSR